MKLELGHHTSFVTSLLFCVRYCVMSIELSLSLFIYIHIFNSHTIKDKHREPFKIFIFVLNTLWPKAGEKCHGCANPSFVYQYHSSINETPLKDSAIQYKTHITIWNIMTRPDRATFYDQTSLSNDIHDIARAGSPVGRVRPLTCPTGDPAWPL